MLGVIHHTNEPVQAAIAMNLLATATASDERGSIDGVGAHVHAAG